MLAIRFMKCMNKREREKPTEYFNEHWYCLSVRVYFIMASTKFAFTIFSLSIRLSVSFSMTTHRNEINKILLPFITKSKRIVCVRLLDCSCDRIACLFLPIGAKKNFYCSNVSDVCTASRMHTIPQNEIELKNGQKKNEQRTRMI